MGAYHAAINARPDVQQRHMNGLQRELRAFREQNPVTFDPRVRARMQSIAKGHQRTGFTADPKAILAEALKREPDAAARYAKQTAAAKQRGHAVQPSIDQTLEAAWEYGVGR